MDETANKKEGRLRISEKFKKQKRFLLDQLGDSGSRFNELIKLGFTDEAETVLQHFGLGKFANYPKSQRELAIEFGISKDMVCRRINGLLIYLGFPDPSIRSKFTKASAAGLETRVVWARKRLIKGKNKQEERTNRKNKRNIAASFLGFPCMPVGLPESRLEDFILIVEARKRGDIDETKSFKDLTIVLRFGILTCPDGKQDLHFWSLRDVQKMTGSCTLTIMRWERDVLENLRRRMG